VLPFQTSRTLPGCSSSLYLFVSAGAEVGPEPGSVRWAPLCAGAGSRSEPALAPGAAFVMVPDAVAAAFIRAWLTSFGGALVIS